MLENIFKYGLSLLFIGGGASRMDWLFGNEVRLAIQSYALDLCQVTGMTVCF